MPLAVPAQLSSQLVLLAQQLGSELHHLLLAAFNVLLMRYSRQDDLTIGCAAQGPLEAVCLCMSLTSILPLADQLPSN